MFRRLLAILLLSSSLSLALGGSSRAADSPAAADKPAASKAEVQSLINTIEDPAKREQLVAQLRLLVGANEGEDDADEQGLLPLISQKMQEASDELLATDIAVPDLRRVVSWVNAQASDPNLRSQWIKVFARLIVILGGGVIAERLLRLGLKSPRGLLEGKRVEDRWSRIPLALGRWLIDLAPVGVFAATASGLLTLPVLKLTGNASLAAVLLMTGYAFVRGTLVLALALFMPKARGLRVLPLDDETATYLFIWARRLTYTGIGGYFGIQALKLLGLPRSGYHSSIKLLGLVVATMLIILVLQNRQAVGAWIRSRGEGDGLPRKVKGLRNRLADVWHVLAVLYIIASFVIWALQVKGGFEFIIRASVLTLAILGVASILSGFLAKLVARAFSIGEELRSQFPSLEARANRYLVIMHNVVRGLVAMLTVLALAQAWGANTVAWMSSELGRELISSTVSILAVLLGAIILWELVSSSIERYLSQTDADGNAVERSARARTLLPLLRNAVLVILVVFVTLIVLSQLGVNIAPLLAGAGVVGVAIGFGSQKLVQDVITGAFILFEDTIAVGDVVKIGDYSGVVEGMTIRTMRLRDVNGQLHTLPFSNVATVTNMSRDFAFHVFDIGVSYREDVDEVMGVIKQLGDEMRRDPGGVANAIDDIEVFGLDRFDDSSVIIRGRLKTVPGKQWTAGREFNRRLKRRFDELGIELAFPTRTIFFGEDKKGRAPPVHVRVEHKSAAPAAAPQAVVAPFTGDAVEYPIGDEAKV